MASNDVEDPPERQTQQKSKTLRPLSCCYENLFPSKSSNFRSRRSTDHFLGNEHDKKNKQKPSLASIIKNTLLVRRRLQFDPDGKLYFIYEPGKQVSSAVRIKNVSKSYVAFKFQTNAPKSCFMRPPNGVLAPKESILTTVMKFLEHPDNLQAKQAKEKFKIVSLKVKQGVDYAPELFEEHKEKVALERILQVVFLDPQTPSKEMEKLKKRLAEAEAFHQARKKPSENASKVAASDDRVIDEWKERRERYLAQQQQELLESP
eukprot:TRINITY_DN8992_c0_g1_i2.p1 TRINITY_DN8992_c0_g1~~TRINITY_DN8992_c0_g1_i2.p1  ORF type:complete len:262 (+),score=54.87 TRINITY_DN8992_c0_g1_i2:453-1238(+)